MKQIVPFTRKIEFSTSVDEITTISLDRKVNKIDGNIISGVFDLYLEYRENDISIDTNKYSESIPFDIDLDDKYDLTNAKLEIDDFYYDIDNKTVELHINVMVDGLELTEKGLEDEIYIHDVTRDDELESLEDLFEETDEKEVAEDKEFTPIFETFDSSKESYVTYNVHIVRDEDTIDSICLKYDVSKEELSYYNNILDIKPGDKLIVPTYKNENNK